MHRSLSLRYLLFTTRLIPIIRVFSPRAESATFFVRHNDHFVVACSLVKQATLEIYITHFVVACSPAFSTYLIPIICVLSPRAESATFLFATIDFGVWQTRILTNSSILWTANHDWNISGNSWKGRFQDWGLSKTGTSCIITGIRLIPTLATLSSFWCNLHGLGQPMWRTQIARFQDPWLKDHGRACGSTQIWGMLDISFISFLVDIWNSKKI